MILDAKGYALRYALLYTALLGIALFVPLFVYTNLMLQINEAKIKKELREVALRIVAQMEEYDNTQQVFRYPRYNQYRSGLFDRNFKPIFSLLDFTPSSFAPGYHADGARRYYILELPDGIYFGARYLIVSTKANLWQIYRMSLLIALGIVVLLALFSYLLLKHFLTPFEQVNRALDNFIKDSMHEINTPLSIINVNIDLFNQKFGSNKYLARIKAAAKVLGNIYNDMDYLIKKDRIDYRRTTIDLSKLVQERVDYFREVAALRRIELSPRIEPGVGVISNRTRLQRLIDNTLSNAIKYSKEGGRVKIYLKSSPKGILLAIRDYGIGIEDPERIFERFYREDHNKGGFGIGLSIVKAIVEEEGIDLRVVSKPERGSTFIYRF
ncbi:MAG: sensor histidine kinase [Nitratiruptor sp.]|nr:sensor histidine kinase [Nitratiruptor sp.]NPA83559.1 HAMP domain-containing histidine kinase [Campylobacterota bacterium]